MTDVRLTSVSSIDGAVMLDEKGVCHGLGVILDGHAATWGPRAEAPGSTRRSGTCRNIRRPSPWSSRKTGWSMSSPSPRREKKSPASRVTTEQENEPEMQITTKISHVGPLVRLTIARPDGTGSDEVIALIDTGTGMSVLDPEILDPLELPVAGERPIQVTGAALQQRPFYSVSLAVHGDKDEVQVFNPYFVNRGAIQMDKYKGLRRAESDGVS